MHPVTGLFTIGVPLTAALAVAQSQFPLPGPPELYYGLMATLPVAAMALTWGLHHANVRIAARTIFFALFCGYAGGHWFAGNHVDINRYDVALLKAARKLAAERGEPIVVDLSRTPLSGFLELFYLPEKTCSVHNVSFLVDDRLPREMLFLTHSGALPDLAKLADAEEIGRSERPLKSRDEASRLVLCSVRLRSDLARKPAESISVSPMQAMHRAAGPVLQ